MTHEQNSKYVYEPSHSLMSRICRRMTVRMARNPVKVRKDQAIVSFSFDDCPVSGLENGVKPLEKEGWLSTIYVSCGLFNIENHLGRMMSEDDAKAAHNNGHEIGEHTFSHRDARSMSLENFKADIARNQEMLNGLGLPASETFAYPYGEAYPGLKKALQGQFKGARGIIPDLHKTNVDLNQIGSIPFYASTQDHARKAIQQLAETGGWLTLFTHDVRENPSPYGCRPDDIKNMIKTIKETGVKVMTLKDAISAQREAAA